MYLIPGLIIVNSEMTSSSEMTDRENLSILDGHYIVDNYRYYFGAVTFVHAYVKPEERDPQRELTIYVREHVHMTDQAGTLRSEQIMLKSLLTTSMHSAIYKLTASIEHNTKLRIITVNNVQIACILAYKYPRAQVYSIEYQKVFKGNTDHAVVHITPSCGTLHDCSKLIVGAKEAKLVERICSQLSVEQKYNF